MPRRRETLDLEELVITVYAALDDALAEAGVIAQRGKLVPRPGPAPEVDDREVLCLAVLQELLDFESDHGFYQWFEANPVMNRLFPRRLSRPNWADRRVLLTPLLKRLAKAFCALDGEDAPPFSSSIPTPSTSAVPCGPATNNGSADSPRRATAPR
jgi:hypothetical protein